MKEYHLSMSQKKPIKQIDRNVSREKMPKTKIKRAAKKSNSPNDDKEMPYRETGPINIGLG